MALSAFREQTEPGTGSVPGCGVGGGRWAERRDLSR